MAKILGSDDVKVYKIQKFLGLNESPDGDTQLKLGEASEIRNWKRHVYSNVHCSTVYNS